MDMRDALPASLSAADQALVDAVLARGSGQRRALAKTITLIESTRVDHQARARQVLATLLPHTGRAIRVGISGVPGSGKSTFIEALGNFLIDGGKRVAVLAVDPSSSISGGSILGDKTRMESLCQREEAFIRPSPTSGALGGVAEKTREAMLLFEAAGFDVIIVETVGVGQSETMVAGMVDLFVLLQLVNAGDDLQTIKKGIVEIADLVLFNKADIDEKAAHLAQLQMTSALTMLRPASRNWRVPVLTVSALARRGIPAFWAEVEKYRETLSGSGEFDAKRRRQALAWMWNMIDSGVRQHFRQHPKVAAELAQLSEAVAEGKMTPGAAAYRLLDNIKQ
ncbi:MAG: methylmalonyl Co-A mutase-associated GTPase MeaB [Pseudomonadota bacterium]